VIAEMLHLSQELAAQFLHLAAELLYACLQLAAEFLLVGLKLAAEFLYACPKLATEFLNTGLKLAADFVHPGFLLSAKFADVFFQPLKTLFAFYVCWPLFHRLHEHTETYRLQWTDPGGQRCRFRASPFVVWVNGAQT
ncbi:MAG TPA: hypothetical protein VFS54_03760, partial [Solirubrobacterales bacterium]|nr:hypothetical protein [Solirubrobacterales bacterium]